MKGLKEQGGAEKAISCRHIAACSTAEPPSVLPRASRQAGHTQESAEETGYRKST